MTSARGDTIRVWARRTTALLVLGLLAVALTATGVGASPTQTDSAVSFNESTDTEQRGDVVRIGLDLTNTATATVTVGDVGENNWAQNVTVRDGDGDGTVTLTINTYTAGTSDDGNTVYGVASSGDSVEHVATDSGAFDPATPQEQTLGADDYQLSVVAGETPAEQTASGADDNATLSLAERSTDAVRTYVAPDSRRDDIDSVASIADLSASDNVTRTSVVATKDILLVRLDADGLGGVLQHELDSGATNATDAFFRASSSAGQPAVLSFDITQTNPDPAVLELNHTNTRLVEDRPTDTYWLRVDTSLTEGETRDIGGGDEFETNVTVLPDTSLTTGVESVYSTWTYEAVDGSVDINADTDNDGEIDEVTVQKAAGEQITGTTNAAPGTELSVKVTGTDSGSPFVKPLTARVRPDATWTAVADFSDNAQGANFTVEVKRGSRSLLAGTVDGRIAEAPTGSVTLNDQESFGSTVEVFSVELSDGGFVAIHLNNASGKVVGTSEYIEAGSDSDISISLDPEFDDDTTLVAMAHQDTDGDQSYEFEFGSSVDAPYTENGSAVTDSAEITIASPTIETANFSVTMTGTNAPVTAGERLDVTADVENIGNAAGTQRLTLRDGDGATVDQQSVSLAAGETTTTTLSWDTGASSDGDRTVTIASANDSDSRTVTVEAPTAETANVSVSITGTNAPITAGETVEVTADIENVGNAAGTQQLTLRDGEGDTLDKQDVTLSAGETTTTTLSWTTGDGATGDVTVTIASANDSDSRTVTVEARDDGDDGGSDDDTQETDTNEPPDASADRYRTWRNETLTVAGPGVLGNDTDPDGDGLSASLVRGPNNGTLSLAADGSFTYRPDDEFSGEDSLTYEASDGDGGTDTATVTLSVVRPTVAVTNVSTNGPIEAGTRLSVVASVANRGQVADTQSVALQGPNGTTLDTVTVTLDPAASTTVTLHWDTATGDAVDGAVTVATTTDAAVGALVVEPTSGAETDSDGGLPTPDGTETPADRATSNGTATPAVTGGSGPGFGVATLLAALLVTRVLGRWRR